MASLLCKMRSGSFLFRRYEKPPERSGFLRLRFALGENKPTELFGIPLLLPVFERTISCRKIKLLVVSRLEKLFQNNIKGDFELKSSFELYHLCRNGRYSVLEEDEEVSLYQSSPLYIVFQMKKYKGFFQAIQKSSTNDSSMCNGNASLMRSLNRLTTQDIRYYRNTVIL